MSEDLRLDHAQSGKRTVNHMHLKACAALLLLLIANTVPAATPTEEPLRAALAAGDLKSAETLAQSLEKDYVAGNLNGDEYTNRLRDILPEKAPRNWESYLQKWRASNPSSYIASFTLGIFYENVAVQLRGFKYANETTPDQLAGYHEYQEKAQAELESSLHLSTKPYPTYCELIPTATSDNQKRATYFKAALQIDPYSLCAWHKYLIQAGPRWGGSTEQMQSLVAQARKSQLRESEKRHLSAIEYTIQAEDATELKRYQEAVFLYQTAYQEFPGKKNVWRLNRAGETAKKGELIDLAVALYGKVLDIDPENTAALNARAGLYEFNQGNLALAFSDYKASADLGNKAAQKIVGSWYLLGKGTTKSPEQAQVYMDKAAGSCTPPLICPPSNKK